jgi:hypothetical protein
MVGHTSSNLMTYLAAMLPYLRSRIAPGPENVQDCRTAQPSGQSTAPRQWQPCAEQHLTGIPQAKRRDSDDIVMLRGECA